jgi:hypothetical protein
MPAISPEVLDKFSRRYWMGKDGFIWWHGVVEDRFDPLYLGRCRVRIVGWHTEDKDLMPTDTLPWAIPLMPITSASQTGVGISPTGPVEGSWVMGFFRDGDDAQDAIMLGTFHGIPEGSSFEGIREPSSDMGFHDPRDSVELDNAPDHPAAVDYGNRDGKGVKIWEKGDIIPRNPHLDRSEVAFTRTQNYPKSTNQLAGTPSPTTPLLARPEDYLGTARLKITGATREDGGTIVKEKQKDSQRIGTVTSASVKSNFEFPTSPYGAQYPYNHVHESESGHIIEVDDTPGSERLHWFHRSGTYTEMHSDGAKYDKISANYYSNVMANSYSFVEGTKVETIQYGYDLLVNSSGTTGTIPPNYHVRVGRTGDLNMETEEGKIVLSTVPKVEADPGAPPIQPPIPEQGTFFEMGRDYAKLSVASGTSSDKIHLKAKEIILETSKITRIAGDAIEEADAGTYSLKSKSIKLIAGMSMGISATGSLTMTANQLNLVIRNDTPSGPKGLNIEVGTVGLGMKPTAAEISNCFGPLSLASGKVPGTPAATGLAQFSMTPAGSILAISTLSTNFQSAVNWSAIAGVEAKLQGLVQAEFSTALGKHTINPAGIHSIKSAGGSLAKLLEDLITALQEHTHPTGTGPSGPPINLPKFTKSAVDLKLLLE